MSFFWRCMFFFRYSFIMLIYKCLWIFLLRIFWNFCNPVSNFFTSQITSCFCCWIALLHVLNGSLADCLAWSRRFSHYLQLTFLLIILTNIFTHIFSKRQRSIAFYKYSIFRLDWIAHIFYILHLNQKLKWCLFNLLPLAV